MRKLAFVLAAILSVSLFSSAPAFADWHEHDIHHFHEHDFDHWRGGRWFNGFHEGRAGWWWIVDGYWYYYPAPIYPYPDPYVPPTVVVQTAPAQVVTTAPVAAPPAVYYCANPSGYYPYVPSCAVAWQKVASAAAPAPVAAPPPAVAALSPHDVDVQQLNVFAARFESIKPDDIHARAKLKELEKQVEDFRQSLYKRDYNAMDVLKNAEDLKSRIAERRAQLAHKGGGAATPAAAGAPPAAVPPGAVVTFPPQQQ